MKRLQWYIIYFKFAKKFCRIVFEHLFCRIWGRELWDRLWRVQLQPLQEQRLLHWRDRGLPLHLHQWIPRQELREQHWRLLEQPLLQWGNLQGLFQQLYLRLSLWIYWVKMWGEPRWLCCQPVSPWRVHRSDRRIPMPMRPRIRWSSVWTPDRCLRLQPLPAWRHMRRNRNGIWGKYCSYLLKHGRIVHRSGLNNKNNENEKKKKIENQRFNI